MLTIFLGSIGCIFRREEDYARLGMKHFNVFTIRKNNVLRIIRKNNCTKLELLWEFRGTKCNCWLGFVQDEGALALLE